MTKIFFGMEFDDLVILSFYADREKISETEKLVDHRIIDVNKSTINGDRLPFKEKGCLHSGLTDCFSDSEQAFLSYLDHETPKYMTKAPTHALTINEIKSTNLQSEDNFYVTDINLAGCNGADELIEKIIKSPYLSSLLRINLSNSDVSLEGLNKLKGLSQKKGIVRPFLKASARFGMQVAVIEVDVIWYSTLLFIWFAAANHIKLKQRNNFL